MAEGSDTREQILRIAGRMMQLRGYSALSFGDVARELGVKAPAIHYHFKTKSDLGVALVQRYRARYRMWMEDAERLPPQKKLEGYLAIFERFAQDGLKACPAGVLQAEYDIVPEPMRKEVRAMVEEIHTWLAQVLEEGRQAGVFRFVGRPQDQAPVLAASVQGSLQAARTLGKAHFQHALRQIRLGLAAEKGVAGELTY